MIVLKIKLNYSPGTVSITHIFIDQQKERYEKILF